MWIICITSQAYICIFDPKNHLIVECVDYVLPPATVAFYLFLSLSHAMQWTSSHRNMHYKFECVWRWKICIPRFSQNNYARYSHGNTDDFRLCEIRMCDWLVLFHCNMFVSCFWFCYGSAILICLLYDVINLGSFTFPHSLIWAKKYWDRNQKIEKEIVSHNFLLLAKYNYGPKMTIFFTKKLSLSSALFHDYCWKVIFKAKVDSSFWLFEHIAINYCIYRNSMKEW